MQKDLLGEIYLSVNLYVYIYPIPREQPKGERREEREGPRQEEGRDKAAGRDETAGRDERRFQARHTNQDVATGPRQLNRAWAWLRERPDRSRGPDSLGPGQISTHPMCLLSTATGGARSVHHACW